MLGLGPISETGDLHDQTNLRRDYYTKKSLVKAASVAIMSWCLAGISIATNSSQQCPGNMMIGSRCEGVWDTVPNRISRPRRSLRQRSSRTWLPLTARSCAPSADVVDYKSELSDPVDSEARETHRSKDIRSIKLADG